MKLNMTAKEFEERKGDLEDLMREWWDEEQSGWSIDKKAKDELKKQAKDIMSSIPVIDSKVAITVSAVVEEILGAEIHPSLIKKGGYSSIDELIEDLLGKLKACCKQKKASGQN